MNITQAAARIREATFEDSNFFPDLADLERSLQRDHSENGGQVPTEEECRTIVMGDDDGQIPEDLQKKFAQTHRYLESLF